MNDPERREACRCYGRTAVPLGLHETVKPKRFEAVLAGCVPGTDLSARSAVRRPHSIGPAWM